MKKPDLGGGKKGSLICLGIFFAMMVIASVAAENVYYAGLSSVVTTKVVRDRLRMTSHAHGSIGFEKETKKYLAPADLDSVELLADNGAQVMPGEKLYRFSTKEILEAKIRLELAALQLEKQNRMLGNTKEEDLQREINDLELKELQGRIASLEALAEKEGVVSADRGGVFHALVSNRAPLFWEQEIGEIVSNTGRAFFGWQMPAEEGKFFHVGNEVSTAITIKEIVDEKQVESDCPYQARIAESWREGADYCFKAWIGDDVTLGMEEGDSVTVTCNYTSPESYAYVVPLSAVSFDKDGKSGRVYVLGTRMRMYGEEHYVAPYQVEVEYQVGNYAALRNFNADGEVVTFSTLPLAADMAVRLMGE